jgi:hypothetical protein
MTLKELLKTGGTWVGAGSSVGVPAFTFFTSFPPPLFPGISLISGAISTAILIFAFAWTPKADIKDQIMPLILRRVKWLLFFSILLLFAYILLLQYTTIIPTGQNTRLQIGFGKIDWTLTVVGKEWKRSKPWLTVTQMAEREAAFTQDRLEILWEPWSIYLGGSLLIALYFLGFSLWASGFALLTKHQSLES